jgi:adenylate cyclase
MKTSSTSSDLIRTEKFGILATVLFCDVVKFTEFASDVTPEALIDNLNSYLTVVVNTLKENRGTVANFIGDTVFAYWLAEDHPDHATLACRFTSSLRERLSVTSHGFTTCTGIHTGNIVLISIDMGTHRLLTPMGDAVNLASRLNGLCTPYKVQAVASERVIKLAKETSAWKSIDSVMVKGRKEPLTVYGLS